jgi:hypothetical protein
MRGTETNELQSTGMTHMLRVHQATLTAKSSHFLTEHHHWRRAWQLQEATEEQLNDASVRQGLPKSLGESPDSEQAKERRLLEAIKASKNSGTIHDMNHRTEVAEGCPQLPLRTAELPLNRELGMSRQEFDLLTVIIETVKSEHSDGNHEHWGGEDRRSKLVNVVMDRSKLWAFWSSVVTALLPVAYRGLSVLYSAALNADVVHDTTNSSCEQIARLVLDRVSQI